MTIKEAVTGVVAISLIASALTVAHTGLIGLLGTLFLLVWYAHLTD